MNEMNEARIMKRENMKEKRVKGLRATLSLTIFFVMVGICFGGLQPLVNHTPMGIGIASAQPDSITTFVNITPLEQGTSIGGEVTVNITIESTDPLTMAQIDIIFDPSILNATGVADGGMFANWNTIGWKIDNENGTIKDIVAFNTPAEGTVMKGTFATITFKTIGAGTSLINFTTIKLINASYDAIPQEDIMTNPGSISTVSIIEVMPSSQLVGMDQVTVNIFLKPAEPIASLQCNILFNPSIIHAVSVSDGGLFDNWGPDWGFNITINNENGTITNIVAFNFVGNVTNAGTFATIVFQGVGSGTSPVNISSVIISSPPPVKQIIPSITNGTITVDGIPPEVNITSISPSQKIDNVTYIWTPVTINATAIDDHLAEVYLIIMDNETYQYLYGKTCYYYEYYSGIPPTNYSETWEYLYNLTDGTTWEEHITVWISVWDETTTWYTIFGLYNETGGVPNIPVYASFDENLTFVGISDMYMGENLTIINGTSTFLLQNMVASEPGHPQYVNTSTFVITEDFRLVPIIVPAEKEYFIAFSAGDTVGNWNSSWLIATVVDVTPPTIEDLTPTTATTGDRFTFTADVTDNVNVSNVYVEYWYGTGSHTNVSMEGGSYIKTITIANTLETLHYFISANDTSDNWNKTAIKDVTITDNDPPTVSITSGPSGTIATSTATFSWTGSDNIGGVQYRYSLDPPGTWSNWGSDTTHTFNDLDDGSYTFSVQAKDGAGNTNTATRSFTISTNEPPTADFTWSPSSPTDIETVRFTDNSDDSDGIIVNYTWNFGDGNISYEQNPRHKYGDNGNYTITLIVKDDKGATDSIAKQIEILNEPPDAYFTYLPDEPKVKEKVNFTDASSDADGSIVNYTWDFGDGNVSYEQNPSHTYSNSGTYTVTLTIKDNDGATDETTLTITVKKEKVDYLLPLIGIVILIIIAIIVVAIWRSRGKKKE